MLRIAPVGMTMGPFVTSCEWYPSCVISSEAEKSGSCAISTYTNCIYGLLNKPYLKESLPAGPKSARNAAITNTVTE